MTKTQLKKATKTVCTILKQIASWIPSDIVKDAAERHGIRYRTFDPWSHLVTLLVVQLSHEESLNGVCDIAQAMSYEWERAGMEIPRRNTLSNANAKRDPAMAEDVFWGLFRHLSAIEPDFVSKNYSGYLARIRNHSFSRLAGIVRGCLWLKKDLFSLLDTYGTAGGWVFRRKSARPAWIQALLPIANAPNGTP